MADKLCFDAAISACPAGGAGGGFIERDVACNDSLFGGFDAERAESSPGEQERAHTVLIGCYGAIQGGITLLPDADPSDGELDVAMLRAEGMLGWLDTVRSIVWDNGVKRQLFDTDEAESSENVFHTRATSVEITLSEPREFQIDGDTLGEIDRVAVSIQPGGLRIPV